MHFPEDFKKNIREAYPQEGPLWLEALPTSLSQLSRKWQLQSMQPVTNLSFNYVAHVEFSDGKKAILKMSPSPVNILKERQWLSSHRDVAPEVFIYDEIYNAFFMQVLQPAVTLKTLVEQGEDDQATRLVGQLIKKLHSGSSSPSLMNIPRLAENIPSFKHLEGRIDPTLLNKVVDLYKDLSLPSSTDVFLHGDLHHENVFVRWRGVEDH